MKYLNTVICALLLLPISLFAQQKHALLIGISNYPQYDYVDAPWAPIHGTNDVQLISPILAKQGFKINTLTNESATHEAIGNISRELRAIHTLLTITIFSSSIKL